MNTLEPLEQRTFAQSRLQSFNDRLAIIYAELFENDPEYAYAKSRTTPEGLARKMTLALDRGEANKDGDGIRRTCEFFGIPHTYKAIRAFLNGQ